MNAAHFAGEDVQAGVAQELPIAAAVDGAEENHAAIGSRFQAVDVCGIVSIAANHHQWPIGLHLAISVEQQLGIVFRLEAADV